MTDEDLTPEQLEAISTWSNVGQPGAAPSERFVPDESRLERFNSITRPHEISLRMPLRSHYMERLKLGHEAMEMEDKWHVYTDDSLVVHFHRSWTGYEMFQLTLQTVGLGVGVATKLVIETNEEFVTWTIEDALESLAQVLVWVFGFDEREVASGLRSRAR